MQQAGAEESLSEGPVIDCHAHAVPSALLEDLCARPDGIHGFAAQPTDQGWLVTVPGSAAPRLVRPKMAATDLRSRWLDEQGISSQVLSPWMDIQPTAAMAPQAARDWARRLNAAMLEEANRGPRRSPVLATVALHDSDQAAADLVAAIQDDGMAGLLLNTNPPGRDGLHDPALKPIWEAAAGMGVPVVLHPPTDGPSRALPGSEQFGNTYCRLVDTTFAVAKLILSGVLDRHPMLALVVVHGGGFLPYQSARLDGGHRADALAGYSLERGLPSAYLSDLYYDTVAMSAPAIRFLVETVGAARVLLGSDYPFPLGDPTPPRTVRAAALPTADTRAVLGGNAAALLARAVHA